MWSSRLSQMYSRNFASDSNCIVEILERCCLVYTIYRVDIAISPSSCDKMCSSTSVDLYNTLVSYMEFEWSLESKIRKGIWWTQLCKVSNVWVRNSIYDSGRMTRRLPPNLRIFVNHNFKLNLNTTTVVTHWHSSCHKLKIFLAKSLRNSLSKAPFVPSMGRG